MKNIDAIEFFSGIGAFASAVSMLNETDISIVSAFDQNSEANKVYRHNFGLSPIQKNLISLKADLVQPSNLWWMSPPCTPFSRRGKRRDIDDPRSKAFLNLINLLVSLDVPKLPHDLIVENVEGFGGSKVQEYLFEKLDRLDYQYKTIRLCSTDFGVPMRRPRLFLLATRGGSIKNPDLSEFIDRRTNLMDYLKKNGDSRCVVKDEVLERYHNVLNIVDLEDSEAVLICFTRGYYGCKKVSGSLVRGSDGVVRYVSPDDIARLLGFPEEFGFPETVSFVWRWKLLGNSVDLRAIRYLLASLNYC